MVEENGRVHPQQIGTVLSRQAVSHQGETVIFPPEPAAELI